MLDGPIGRLRILLHLHGVRSLIYPESLGERLDLLRFVCHNGMQMGGWWSRGWEWRSRNSGVDSEARVLRPSIAAWACHSISQLV